MWLTTAHHHFVYTSHSRILFTQRDDSRCMVTFLMHHFAPWDMHVASSHSRISCLHNDSIADVARWHSWCTSLHNEAVTQDARSHSWITCSRNEMWSHNVVTFLKHSFYTMEHTYWGKFTYRYQVSFFFFFLFCFVLFCFLFF